MNHERLEWVISGLSRYKLTEKESQFVKAAESDFNQKNMLTEQQEEKLENLYKEKSRFLPNKTTSPSRKVVLLKRPRREGTVQNSCLKNILPIDPRSYFLTLKSGSATLSRKIRKVP